MSAEGEAPALFENAGQWTAWLKKHHASSTGIWLRIAKKDAGLVSLTIGQALDGALCYGWIDGQRKSLDAESYLQRYTPRGRKSIWSKINVANVGRLEGEGRMTPHGMKQVELAKADGRWDRAYGGSKEMEIPAALVAALKGHRKALQTLAGLSAQNRFAIAFRLHNLKTEAGRTRKLAALVQMLKDGETIYPQKPKT